MQDRYLSSPYTINLVDKLTLKGVIQYYIEETEGPLFSKVGKGRGETGGGGEGKGEKEERER